MTAPATRMRNPFADIRVVGLLQVYCRSTMMILSYYYRAMHFSAKRGIAIACRLSVCLSVCL